MPMGPSIAGFAYFAGVKFLGYSAYAHGLRRKYHDDPSQGASRTFKIGGLRTAIGIVFGLSYGLLAATGLFDKMKMAELAFLLGLLPIRFGEWLLLLRLAFKDKLQNKKLTVYSVAIGIVVSYVLDLVGIAAAFVLPGGLWV